LFSNKPARKILLKLWWHCSLMIWNNSPLKQILIRLHYELLSWSTHFLLLQMEFKQQKRKHLHLFCIQ
jgi:hypothetical protein